MVVWEFFLPSKLPFEGNIHSVPSWCGERQLFFFFPSVHVGLPPQSSPSAHLETLQQKAGRNRSSVDDLLSCPIAPDLIS